MSGTPRKVAYVSTPTNSPVKVHFEENRTFNLSVRITTIANGFLVKFGSKPVFCRDLTDVKSETAYAIEAFAKWPEEESENAK